MQEIAITKITRIVVAAAVAEVVAVAAPNEMMPMRTTLKALTRVMRRKLL
jgi:hypothetical protein